MLRAIEAAALQKYLGQPVYHGGGFATTEQPKNEPPDVRR
jgi:hypothetical protein